LRCGVAGPAGALARAGLKRGDVIAAALPDSDDALCACLGAAGVGAFAPLDPALPEAEHE
jgi:acyl-CoA synthetase (AMP-forming)/AMP-acid ligase II